MQRCTINYRGEKKPCAILFLYTNYHLILLQEFEFNGDITAHLFIFFTVDLELDLRLLDLWQCAGVARAKIQFLQISTICIIFDPAEERERDVL